MTDQMAHLSVESVQFHNVHATEVPAKSCENRTYAHDQHENMLLKLNYFQQIKILKFYTNRQLNLKLRIL